MSKSALPDPYDNACKKSTPEDPASAGGCNMNRADASAVVDALNTELPDLATIKATEVEHLTEVGMASLADDRVRMKGGIAKYSALATSEIDRCEEELNRLNNERDELTKSLKTNSSGVRQYKNVDFYGIAAPVIFTKAGWVISLSLLVLVSTLGIFLGTEFNFGISSLANSKLSLGQTPDGARGLIFPMTFSSFVALTFWTHAEQRRLHWTALFVSRLAAAFTFLGVPVVSFIIGTMHLPPGKSYGSALVLMPILTCLLVLSTYGIKYAIAWVAELAFPYEMVVSKETQRIKGNLEFYKVDIVIAKKDLSNAKQLLIKSNAFVNEFIGRTRNVWQESQSEREDKRLKRESRRRRRQAEADDDFLSEE